MKVYQRMARAFRAEGITHTFGIMGDGNMYWLNEMIKLGATDVEVRHEGAGLGMADGYARVTHAPAVATATCGPGVTQLATAFVTAARAHSPIVAFCGESPTTDPEYTQRLDQAKFADACEAGFERLVSADQTDDAVRKAFYRAKLESRPIMLSCPMDIQQKNFEDDDEEYKPSSAMFSPGAVHPDTKALERAAEHQSDRDGCRLDGEAPGRPGAHPAGRGRAGRTAAASCALLQGCGDGRVVGAVDQDEQHAARRAGAPWRKLALCKCVPVVRGPRKPGYDLELQRRTGCNGGGGAPRRTLRDRCQ